MQAIVQVPDSSSKSKELKVSQESYIWLCTKSMRVRVRAANMVISGYVREKKVPDGGDCACNLMDLAPLEEVKSISSWCNTYLDQALYAVTKYCNHQQGKDMKCPSKPLRSLVFSENLDPPNPWAVKFCTELELESNALLRATLVVAFWMKIQGLVDLLCARLAWTAKRGSLNDLMDSLKIRHPSEHCWVCKQAGVDSLIDRSVIDYRTHGRCRSCSRTLREIYEVKQRFAPVLGCIENEFYQDDFCVEHGPSAHDPSVEGSRRADLGDGKGGYLVYASRRSVDANGDLVDANGDREEPKPKGTLRRVYVPVERPDCVIVRHSGGLYWRVNMFIVR